MISDSCDNSSDTSVTISIVLLSDILRTFAAFSHELESAIKSSVGVALMSWKIVGMRAKIFVVCIVD